jgi:hypothetical protein
MAGRLPARLHGFFGCTWLLPPGKVSEALFPLQIGYMAVDTGLSEDEIRAAFKELIAVGIIDWDP